MPPDLVLYNYWRSSPSFRVRFALGAKGLPYKSIAVDLIAGDQHREEYLARNYISYVPCLHIDGRPVMESVAIIELLDELFPEIPLYPREPWARARVRALVEAVNAGTQPLHCMAILERLGSDRAVRRDWIMHFCARGLANVERLMDLHAEEGVRGRYAYGDTLTAADVFLVPEVYVAMEFGVSLSALPRVAAAADAAFATEAARAARPERPPDQRSR